MFENSYCLEISADAKFARLKKLALDPIRENPSSRFRWRRYDLAAPQLRGTHDELRRKCLDAYCV